MFILCLTYVYPIIMARVEIIPDTEAEWKRARLDLRKRGIILTHRRHSLGGYVCYASPQLRTTINLLTL